MNYLFHVLILITIPTAFAFVKKPNITIKTHPLSLNFKKGPVYVHTTLSPEARKRSHTLFPQTVTKYVVSPYTPYPYTVKRHSDESKVHSKLRPMLNKKTLPAIPKYNYLRNKPNMGLYRTKTKALNEELLRDGVPQISIGLSSEEVNTETNENFREEFNQELINDMQISENFDDEIDPYEGTLRIKSLRHHPSKDLYADSMRSKHPTKYAIKDSARKGEMVTARKGERINLKDKIITKESIVNMTMHGSPEDAPLVVVTLTTQEPEPEAPKPKFDYLRPKRHSKYYVQDIEDFNKDLEELIFLNRYDNEINVDEVKKKDADSMSFAKISRKKV